MRGTAQLRPFCALCFVVPGSALAALIAFGYSGPGLIACPLPRRRPLGTPRATPFPPVGQTGGFFCHDSSTYFRVGHHFLIPALFSRFESLDLRLFSETQTPQPGPAAGCSTGGPVCAPVCRTRPLHPRSAPSLVPRTRPNPLPGTVPDLLREVLHSASSRYPLSLAGAPPRRRSSVRYSSMPSSACSSATCSSSPRARAPDRLTSSQSSSDSSASSQ